MASAKTVKRSLIGIAVAGIGIGTCYRLFFATTEPEIPSCSSCELRMQFFGGKATVSGNFSTVDPNVFKEARVLLDQSGPNPSSVPTALPTGGPYTNTVQLVNGRPGTAEMQFRYRTQFGDLRWTTATDSLTVR